MGKIILTRGIQGSGKSTWAKKWVYEDPEHRIRYNNDDMRNMFGVYWPAGKGLEKREDMLKHIKTFILNKYMELNYDIVVDNMNLNPKEWEYFETTISKWNEERENQYEIEFKDFFINVDECIRRDSMRANPIGEKVIRQTWRKYRTFILSTIAKKMSDDLEHNENDHLNAIIVDLDGTLCLNTEGRPFYGEGCAEGIKDDKPIKSMVQLLIRYYLMGTNILIVTGREQTPEIETATKNWLDEQGILYDKLFMRPIGSKIPGVKLKEEIYESKIKGNYNILFALEDSQKVVDMYRSNGLLVLQPTDGNC